MKRYPMFMTDRINKVKITIFPNTVYGLSAISIIIFTTFFADIKKYES